MDQKSNDKLIKLLNDSEDGFVSKFVYYDELNRTFRLDNWQSFHYTLILSKEYCFIKRLVENDKIEAHEIRFDNYEWTEFDKVDSTIMLLSIQDNPIEFLISILK